MRDISLPMVNDELLEGIWLAVTRDFRWVAAPMVVTNGVIFLLIYSYVPLSLSLAWMFVGSIIPLARIRILHAIAKNENRPVHCRVQLLVYVAVIHGFSRAASVLFFPFIPELNQALLCIIHTSVCASAIATLVGYRPLVLGFVTPIVGSLALMWLLQAPLRGESMNLLHLSVGLLMVLLWLTLVIQAKDFFTVFKESFTLRFQQRGLAAELQIALAQQRELAASLQIALAKAESSDRAKTRFLAAASHDLRQPLHSLSLFAMALRRRDLDLRSSEIVECIHAATSALAKQMDGILDISKLDAGIMSTEIQAFHLAPLVGRLGKETSEVAMRKGLELISECPKDLIAFTDPILLERMIRNLLDNALKYTKEGYVKLVAIRNNDNIFLTISDTGIGIPFDEQQQVFEEFYQLENPERDRNKGLGLGLSIVRRLAQLLQLNLKLTSESGRGTEVELKLLVGDVHRLSGSLNKTKPQRDDYQNLHVLIIDDERSVREGMHALLSELGCHVSQADSSESAAVTCQQIRPDLVLADFRLKGNDTGIIAINAVRKIHPSIPACLISGDTANTSLQAAVQHGLILHHKPVSFDILQSELDRAIEQKNAMRPNHI